jgi:hypothetical protein
VVVAGVGGSGGGGSGGGGGRGGWGRVMGIIYLKIDLIHRFADEPCPEVRPVIRLTLDGYTSYPI